MGFSARPSSVLSLICETLLLRLPNLLHFGKERVKRLLPFRAWEGAAALRFIAAALGGLEGWDALAVPEWSGRSGSASRSRGGQTGGVFPWSFLFLASLRARAYSHPFGLATAGRRWRDSVPPGGQRLEAREDLPGEAVRGKLPAAEGAAPAGPPRRGSRGRPPPTVAGSASSRAGAARGPGSCLSPPSSTVGATLSSQGAGRGCGGCRPGPSAGRRGEPGARSPGALQLGDPPPRGCHPPAQGRVAGRAPSQEPRAPETFEGWGPERKPPASPGGIRLFSQRKTNGSPWVCLPFPPSMRELCGTSRPCRRLQSLLVKFASQPFDSPASPPRTPGVCQG